MKLPISPLLQSHLDKKHLTQLRLARHIGMCQSQLNVILNRKHHARLDTLERIAAGMEIEVSTLIRLMKAPDPIVSTRETTLYEE